ncbi:hypothetical protein [Helicobacter cetorum]|uniref:Uncharacterized protein n=1 Tax=Helicobacter cetorum (strain ATCC BAA-429 / MIT 00-7128) TaxID=182217 RepID=I0ENM0_HELC0|nr:hypothetical protein [Helicobacter cetorum]AFI04539.1 hypothetical protein HCW_06395 [Helicobacter cetorum MIT 00-7128]
MNNETYIERIECRTEFMEGSSIESKINTTIGIAEQRGYHLRDIKFVNYMYEWRMVEVALLIFDKKVSSK